ncbi:hypothetical protein [Flavobacterium sp. 81]|nr:hypothetical protein [Flavobacterium sp. 81]
MSTFSTKITSNEVFGLVFFLDEANDKDHAFHQIYSTYLIEI